MNQEKKMHQTVDDMVRSIILISFSKRPSSSNGRKEVQKRVPASFLIVPFSTLQGHHPLMNSLAMQTAEDGRFQCRKENDSLGKKKVSMS